MEAIKRFLSVDSGYGNGFSSGNGDGYGFGDGYGNGNGSGNVDGCGYGFGDGRGGLEAFNGHTVYLVDRVPTLIYSVKGNLASGAVVNDDLTLRECRIAKVDNYFAHGDTAHKAFEDAQSKSLQNKPIGTRVKRFVALYPDFDKKIPCKELFGWHHILTESCELGRRQFAEEHNIDVENDSLTAREFVALTKDSYGGENVKLLAAEYGFDPN